MGSEVYLEIHGGMGPAGCSVRHVSRWQVMWMERVERLRGIKLLMVKRRLMVAAEGVSTRLVPRAPAGCSGPSATQDTATASSSPVSGKLVRAFAVHSSSTTWNIQTETQLTSRLMQKTKLELQIHKIQFST